MQWTVNPIAPSDDSANIQNCAVEEVFCRPVTEAAVIVDQKECGLAFVCVFVAMKDLWLTWMYLKVWGPNINIDGSSAKRQTPINHGLI